MSTDFIAQALTGYRTAEAEHQLEARRRSDERRAARPGFVGPSRAGIAPSRAEMPSSPLAVAGRGARHHPRALASALTSLLPSTLRSVLRSKAGNGSVLGRWAS